MYYITKQIIPALGRVLNLVGADLAAWYNELPKVNRAIDFRPDGTAGLAAPPVLLPSSKARSAFMTSRDPAPRAPTSTIDQFYPSRHCRLCDALTHGGKAKNTVHAACEGPN